MRSGIHKASPTNHVMRRSLTEHIGDDVGAYRTGDILPVTELGAILVLTHVLATPLSSATAIEELREAAGLIGWQPVGDVLRVASERCLERGHVRIDTHQQLILTEPGRRWLIAVMSQHVTGLPRAGAELLLACQLAVLPQLEVRERRRILDAAMAGRRDQGQCQQACGNAQGPWHSGAWHDRAQAQLAADLQRLDALCISGR